MSNVRQCNTPLAPLQELTSFALELPVFRELGTEIIPKPTKHMRRRGSTYLQEKLPAGRCAASGAANSLAEGRAGARAVDWKVVAREDVAAVEGGVV